VDACLGGVGGARPGARRCLPRAVALDPATLARLDWRRAVAENEPWRAWTAAVVHANGSHLAANAAGALLVGAYGVVARVPWRSTIAWLVAWPATQALLVVLAPSLARYVGLSGVLHAGIAVAALHVALTAGAGLGRRRAIGAATFAIVVAKVLLETPWDRRSGLRMRSASTSRRRHTRPACSPAPSPRSSPKGSRG
jgi:rhomboid family GlyGly-CTERM serine protease